MARSKKFDLVRSYYKLGSWDIRRVRNAVGKYITPEEFEDITGQAYDE